MVTFWNNYILKMRLPHIINNDTVEFSSEIAIYILKFHRRAHGERKGINYRHRLTQTDVKNQQC